MVAVVERALEHIGFGAFQWRLLLLCAAGYFAVCSELLVVALLEEPLTKQFGLSAEEYAWLPFTVSLCSLAASSLGGTLADRWGRRPIFLASLLLVGGAGLLCAWSSSWRLFIGLRALVGVGNGGLAVADYVVFQEFTPRAARGRYLYLVFGAGCLGVLYLATFAAFAELGWRQLVLLAALPTLPTGLLRCLVQVETPHYLAAAGRPEEAYAVLKLVSETNGVRDGLLDEAAFLAEAEAEQGSHRSDEAGKWSAVLGHHKCRLTPPLAAIWVLQSSAYWGLTLFLPSYFVAVGMAPRRTIFAMVLCELPGCLLSAWLIEHPKVGRVRTLQGNFLLASLAALAMGVLAGGSLSVWAMAALACAIYFFMIPNWGVLSLYTPESYPTTLRGAALGLMQTISGFPSIASPFLSARLAEQSHAYMLLWGFCLLGAFSASLLLPTGPTGSQDMLLASA